MRSMILFAILSILTITSCTLFTPETIVKHPDAPMLIEEISGNWASVSIYDSRENRMVHYGWVDLRELKGWTLHKFDWEAHLKSRDK